MKVLVGAIGMVAFLGAIAYAAAPRRAADTGTERRSVPVQLPRPKITLHPNKMATSTSARFGFTAGQRVPRFQCRLDRRGWRACQAPTVFTDLAPGKHAFSVRALDRLGRHGRATRFRWRLLEPKDFSIVPQLEVLSPLYPGAPPVALPLRIDNPNPVPIHITRLQVGATDDPRGCPSATNLELIHSSASSLAPLRVPAKGSVSLPTQGVSSPAIRLRDLPVNQDACQHAHFPLTFSGTARG